jgi:DNA-binding transcriptional regulator LsrR (DeoR family)
MSLFDQVTIALVGIGTLEPSGLLASSGNIFSPEELNMLRAAGAVGDICLRFFDASGTPVTTPLDERVIGIKLDQLRHVKRSVGIAELSAIHGALQGRLINVLITDRFTAQHLLDGIKAVDAPSVQTPSQPI